MVAPSFVRFRPAIDADCNTEKGFRGSPFKNTNSSGMLRSFFTKLSLMCPAGDVANDIDTDNTSSSTLLQDTRTKISLQVVVGAIVAILGKGCAGRPKIDPGFGHPIDF
jgi:hypothetical protein